MINLEFTGLCEGCRQADLALSTLYAGTDVMWEVQCKHRAACDRAYAKRTAEDIAEEMRRSQDD